MDALPTEHATPRIDDEPVSELAARTHIEAARLAESSGHLSAAREHRAFADQVRAALREFDSPRTGRRRERG